MSEIDAYIEAAPEPARSMMRTLCDIVRQEAPGAIERIAYQMPTFTLKRNLVHFAAFANHVGFYPTPTGMDEFATELSRYKTGKGSLRLPLDEPVPVELIRRIVRFRVAEEAALEARQKEKKARPRKEP